MSKEVLIDASRKFALRREVAELETDFNEFTFAKHVMAAQPEYFLASAAEHDSRVAGALRELASEGMEVGLYTDAIEEEIDANNDFGVMYVKGEQHLLRPRLHLTMGMIGLIDKNLDPFLEGYEGTIGPKQRLEGSVTAASWFALGKWIVDTIDPRYVEDPDTSKSAIQAVSVFTGVDVGQVDIASQQEAIASSSLILSYRMAGAMAYKGLARYLRHEGLDMGLSLSIYQRLISGHYDMQVQENVGSVNVVSFALAKPLNRSEVGTVFECLGPVAEDLQNQGRLPTQEY